ncbi:MAG: hypothetical protein FJ301_02185 [Planctomycetes bacterium]|nr:hypothetical protein [Planctomycetota bacterium]
MNLHSLFAAALLAAPAFAQTIAWGPVLPTLAVTDVNTNGTLVVARNLHSATAAQSPLVHGVQFVGAFAPIGWTNASTLAMNGSTTGDAGFDLLLSSARATSATTPSNPTGWGAIRIDNLAPLTVGRTYEIQCWFTDQRLGNGMSALYDRAMTLSSAIGAVTLAGGEATNLGTLLQGPLSAPLDGDPDNNPALGGADAVFGSHCTGAFTRTTATDQLWLLVQGSHPLAANSLRSHLTAFQIRDVSPTWSSYGAGCGTVTLALGSLPAIGGTFMLHVGNLGPGLPFMLTGIAQLNVPLPLPEFVPGCTALASPDLVDFLGGGGMAMWSLPIPNNPALSGFQLYNQALEFGALLSLSNGGAATIR